MTSLKPAACIHITAVADDIQIAAITESRYSTQTVHSYYDSREDIFCNIITTDRIYSE